ncbi:hypothetical protein TNCV_849441 [Trichonephila clavipes]|uniref:Uncharacterized protein n=1 Tax=Trichonephila clavipes TaxID=2585209 RepID=A0A8X6V6X0_TRICX|nr:hypothetical protein TNCV_849441 [Trichonephila clavipes]
MAITSSALERRPCEPLTFSRALHQGEVPDAGKILDAAQRLSVRLPLLEGFWRRTSPFEQWSSNEEDTRADTPSLNYHTTPTGGRSSSPKNKMCIDPLHGETFSDFFLTVDDSLFLGTWTDKQSSIPYHDVFDAGLDFVGFHSLRSDMSAIGCGVGIREEGLRDDYLELKFYAVLRA